MSDDSQSNWFLRWLAASPSRWLGRSSSVQQDIAGTTHGLSYLRNLARGNRIRQPKVLDELDDTAQPLLLIHGFLGTRGSMYRLERRLVNDGFCVFSFNLGTLNTRDIRRSAFLIHRKIERILAQTSWDSIDIVGHSMGGLIGLYYVKKLGGHTRVRKMIMLGAPYRGTWSALAGIACLGLYSTSSWQLLPRSRFLDELGQGPLPSSVEYCTLAAARDWVCPLPSTRIPGVKAITVPLGHSSLVVSEEVYQRLKNVLRPERRPVASGPAPAATAAQPRAHPGDGAATAPIAAGSDRGDHDDTADEADDDTADADSADNVQELVALPSLGK